MDTKRLAKFLVVTGTIGGVMYVVETLFKIVF